MSFNKYLKENIGGNVETDVDELTNSIINYMMSSGVDQRFSDEAIGRMANNIVKDISDKIERIMS